MVLVRLIPCLLLANGKLVKTVRFNNPRYIGDPVNAIKIYNEKEVDELILLDISASMEKREPDYRSLEKVANECFMPVCYGGGITNTEQIKRILEIGIEKVALNSGIYSNPDLIAESSARFGNQCIVASIDVKKSWFGKYHPYFYSGRKRSHASVADFAKMLERKGAGEILLNNIDKEGTWSGFDLELIQEISRAVKIPVIASGGAGNLQHIRDAIILGNASAVALGSMAVYQNKGMGVLINFPDKEFIEKLNNK